MKNKKIPLKFEASGAGRTLGLILIAIALIAGSFAVDTNIEPQSTVEAKPSFVEPAKPIDLNGLEVIDQDGEQPDPDDDGQADDPAAEDLSTTPPPQTPKLQNPTPGYGAHILAYAWNSGGSSSIIPQNIVSDLERIGASHAAYNPALIQVSGAIASSHIKTPTAQTTSSITGAVIASGRPVSVKPIIDSGSLGGGYWRGTFKPSNPDQWFASYFSAVKAQYAAGYGQGSRHLVIGTELSQLESTAYAGYWNDAIADIRSSYPGTYISYDQNWDRVGIDPAFAAGLNEISYSAYFPFSESNLDGQWQNKINQIASLQNSTGIHRSIGEFGLALTGTLATPYDEDKTGATGNAPNPDLVRRYVTSGCKAMKSAGLSRTLWAGSYATEWIGDGASIDATRGYYLGAEENAALAAEISAACR